MCALVLDQSLNVLLETGHQGDGISLFEERSKPFRGIRDVSVFTRSVPMVNLIRGATFSSPQKYVTSLIS